MPRQRALEAAAAAVLILAIAIFHFCTIRRGFTWNTSDYGLYIHHARNIAEGRPYAATGFIPNPAFRSHSPSTYPPVFPLLLAPVYARYGLDLAPMKAECVVLLAFLLAALYVMLRKYAAAPCALAVVGIFGLHPFCWVLKDYVLPDFAFIFFLVCCGILVDKLYEKPFSVRFRPLPVVACALLMWIAYGTRSAGIAVLPALFLYDFLKCRKLTKFAIAVAAVFLAFAAAEAMLVHSEATYLSALVIEPSVLFRTGSSYAYAIYDFWNTGLSKLSAVALAVGATGLACFGALRRSREGWSFLEVFAVPYLAILLLWQAGHGLRYLLPILPVYVFFAAYGAFSLPAWRKSIVAIAGAATVLTFGVRYSRADWANIATDTDGLEQLSGYIRGNTNLGDVFVCASPRVLSLLTGRPASPYAPSPGGAAVWPWVDHLKARYIVRNTSSHMDAQYLDPPLAAHRRRLTLVYAVGDFELYAVQPAFSTGRPQRLSSPAAVPCPLPACTEFDSRRPVAGSPG